MNDEVRKLVEAAHAMGEMLKLHYDSFREAGFNDRQAMQLTLEMVRALCGPQGKSES